MIEDAPTIRDYRTRMSPARLVAWVRGMLAAPAAPETPAEAGERRKAAREDAGLRIARSRAAQERELPALAQKEAEALARVEAIAPKYQEALRAYDTARMAHARRAADLSYEQVLATREIEAAAEPIIAEFATALIDIRQQALETPCEEQERNALFDDAGTPYYELWNNRAAIIARSDAALAAYRTAEAMKADPNQDDIRERLAALVENLPDASEMSLVYKPPLREMPRRWPTYEESRAELIGVNPDELRRIRRRTA